MIRSLLSLVAVAALLTGCDAVTPESVRADAAPSGSTATIFGPSSLCEGATATYTVFGGGVSSWGVTGIGTGANPTSSSYDVTMGTLPEDPYMHATGFIVSAVVDGQSRPSKKTVQGIEC